MPRLNFSALRERAGIVYAAGQAPVELDERSSMRIAQDSELQTMPNAGIPLLFTTYVDPRVIEVLVTPMNAAKAFNERKLGSWTDETVSVPVVENVGSVTTYGDFNDNALSDANVNYPYRQTYHYQTIIRIGEREMEKAGRARLDWATQKQTSAALALNKFQNKSYLFGIEGLEIFGMLNDPSLLPSIAGKPWAKMDVQSIYDSIQRLYTQLVSQTGGLIDVDASMTMLLSPTMNAAITATNMYGLNVSDMIKKNFPNLKIVTIPEYKTKAGEMVQLVVDEYEAIPTVELGFTEKMRVHALIQKQSGYEQKRTQGTVGALIYRPMFIASMLAS